MKRINLSTAAMALAIALISTPGVAHAQVRGLGNAPALHGSTGDGPVLHVSNRWKECSIQLDAALTQAAWRQFTEEAGLVAYFRPLVDAQPMGRGRFEVSLLQWQTNIDDHDSAWNDTFVHPDSEHWLFESEKGLAFPGLMARVGVSNKTDIGVYYTKNPNANYGFFGAQVQQNILGRGDCSAATRLSFSSLYGPEDVDLAVLGWDVLASREFELNGWASVSPYAGFSSYLSASNEKSPVVDLDNEVVGGSQAMVGAVVRLAGARLAMEYNAAKVNSISMKVGFGR